MKTPRNALYDCVTRPTTIAMRGSAKSTASRIEGPLNRELIMNRILGVVKGASHSCAAESPTPDAAKGSFRNIRPVERSVHAFQLRAGIEERIEVATRGKVAASDEREHF